MSVAIYRGDNQQLRNALRHLADRRSTGVSDAAMFHEAAARIEALEAENARLREALEPFAFIDKDEPDTTQEAWELRYLDRFKDWIDFEDIEAARAALQEGGE